MLRAYCSNWSGGDLLPELSRDEIHHLVRVRRLKVGEEIEILNGKGGIGRFRVKGLRGGTPDLESATFRQMGLPPLKVRLFVAIPKGKAFATLLHKAVELGVSEITPMVTTNTEGAHFRTGAKKDRWENILVEAVKQSGNPWIPQLHESTSFADCLGDSAAEARLCGALQPCSVPIWNILTEELNPHGIIDIFVGPEGDFSEEEYKKMRLSGCRFASLGPLVLKVETAVILMLGALRLWQDGASADK